MNRNEVNFKTNKVDAKCYDSKNSSLISPSGNKLQKVNHFKRNKKSKKNESIANVPSINERLKKYREHVKFAINEISNAASDETIVKCRFPEFNQEV